MLLNQRTLQLKQQNRLVEIRLHSLLIQQLGLSKANQSVLVLLHLCVLDPYANVSIVQAALRELQTHLSDLLIVSNCLLGKLKYVKV